MADDEEEQAIAEDEAEDVGAEEAVAEAPKKEKKQKKVVRRRKSKKDKEKPLTGAIRLAVESGKVEFGARTGIVASLLGKAKLIVLARNTPEDTRKKVSSYAKLSEVPLLDFDGTTMELGSVCGKPFPVSVLSVYDAGASHIFELAKKAK